MGRSRPRVTTVVPTFRRPKLLARALESVSLQTFGDLQVRVYDNASGDETEAVVRGYSTRDPRFQYHLNSENIGSNPNFRLGLEQVDTEYFSFLSDDDLLLPRLYELSVAALDEHPEAAMATTAVIHTNRAGSFAREPALPPGVHRAPSGLVGMLELNQPCWTGVLFRTAAVNEVGGLDDATVIDLDLELRVAAHHAIVVLPEAGAILTTDNHFGKCVQWPPAFDLTIAKIEADLDLPAEVRQLARPMLESRLKKMIYDTGVVASRMGKVDLARSAARVLSTRYGDRRRALLVSGLASLGRFAPAIAPLYRRARGTRGRPQSDQLREELQMIAPEVMSRL
jgi:glycosyltransferase involved in cell wall biosynthesis